MKNKFMAITMAFILSFLSVAALPIKSQARTIDSYDKLLTLMFGRDGEWKTWENIGADADEVIQDILRLVVGVFVSDSQANWIFEHLATLLGVDPDTFMEENFTCDGDKINCTGAGRRAIRGLATSCMEQNAHQHIYKSVVLNDNMLNYNNIQNLTSTQVGYIKDFFNTYSDDYYIFVGLRSSINFSTDYASALNFNRIHLVDKSFVFWGNSAASFYNGNASGYDLAYDITGQDSMFFRLYNTRCYADVDTIGYSKYIDATTLFNAYANGNELTFTNGTADICFPYNSTYGILNLPKIYNNGNMPYIRTYDWAGSTPAIFVSYNTQEFLTFYDNKNYYLASIYDVPPYFVGDTYYNYDYSSDTTTTIGSQTLYDNCPTYNNIANYYGDYYEQNGNVPSGDVIYNYINNYYYGDDNGGGSGGSGGGIFDWLGDLGSVLGSLISGLGNLIVNLLSGLTSVFDNIANVIPESFNTFFTTIFSWLPPEWISLITLSMTLGLVYGLIKLIRG